MKARYRVRANERFQEIRKQGDAYHDALLVLLVLANGLPHSRFGFSVSNRIGGAVVRNRIKRRLREAIRLRMEEIKPGWDIVFIAKHPIRRADYHQMDAACARLLRRAHLFRDEITRDGATRDEQASGSVVDRDEDASASADRSASDPKGSDRL